MPKELTGTLQVIPKIDTGPFKSEIIRREIQIRNGRWLAKSE